MWEAFARVKSWHSCWKNPKWTFYPGQISVLFTIYTLGSSSCKWRYRSRCPKRTKNLTTRSSLGGLFVLPASLCVLHGTAAPTPARCKFKKCTKLSSKQILRLRFSILKKRKKEKKKIDYFFSASIFQHHRINAGCSVDNTPLYLKLFFSFHHPHSSGTYSVLCCLTLVQNSKQFL